jgi:hypothetical protein
MLNIKDPSNFRRTLAGLSLVIAPLVILVASVTQPDTADDSREYLADLAEEAGRADLSTTLFIVGFWLLLPGVLGLIHLVRRRGVVLTHIGGVLLVLGMVAYPVLFSTTFYDLSIAENVNIDEGVRAFDGIEDYVGPWFVFIPAILGFAIGLILLAIGVFRAGIAPLWVLVLVILANVLILVSGGGGVSVVSIIGSLAFAAAFGYLGLRLLGMTDEQWGNPERLPPAETP